MGWAFFIQGDHSVPVSAEICSFHDLPRPLPPTVTSTTACTLSHNLCHQHSRYHHHRPWPPLSAIASPITRPGLHTQPWPPPSTTDSTPSHSPEQPPLPSSNVAFISNHNHYHHQAWSLPSAMGACPTASSPFCYTHLPLIFSYILFSFPTLFSPFLLFCHFTVEFLKVSQTLCFCSHSEMSFFQLSSCGSQVNGG